MTPLLQMMTSAVPALTSDGEGTATLSTKGAQYHELSLFAALVNSSAPELIPTMQATDTTESAAASPIMPSTDAPAPKLPAYPIIRTTPTGSISVLSQSAKMEAPSPAERQQLSAAQQLGPHSADPKPEILTVQTGPQNKLAQTVSTLQNQTTASLQRTMTAEPVPATAAEILVSRPQNLEHVVLSAKPADQAVGHPPATPPIVYRHGAETGSPTNDTGTQDLKPHTDLSAEVSTKLHKQPVLQTSTQPYANLVEAPTYAVGEPTAVVMPRGHAPAIVDRGPHGATPSNPTPSEQVRTAISSQQGSAKIEVQLDPPELGRVQIDFEVGRGGGIRAIVTSAEPETLDLLKRNAADFIEDLEDQGFEDVDLHFGKSSQDETLYASEPLSERIDADLQPTLPRTQQRDQHSGLLDVSL